MIDESRRPHSVHSFAKEREHTAYIPISVPELSSCVLLCNILLPGTVTLTCPSAKKHVMKGWYLDKKAGGWGKEAFCWEMFQ